MKLHVVIMVLSTLSIVKTKSIPRNPVLPWTSLVQPRPIHLSLNHNNRRDTGTAERVKITGGEEVQPNSIPYQVALFLNRDDGQYFCGGTLISRKYVLTAGHCLYNANSVEVILGAHNIREQEPWQVRMVSTNMIIHEKYNSSKLGNDIALVLLPELAPINDKISLVTLPTRRDVSNDFAGVLSQQSGWGKVSDQVGNITDKLQAVKSRVLSNAECNEWYVGVLGIEHVCTDTSGGKSVCNGDSGGPLVTEDGVQIGISAFVIIFGCEAGWPAGFTRLTEYLDWIGRNSDIIIKN